MVLTRKRSKMYYNNQVKTVRGVKEPE